MKAEENEDKSQIKWCKHHPDRETEGTSQACSRASGKSGRGGRGCRANPGMKLFPHGGEHRKKKGMRGNSLRCARGGVEWILWKLSPQTTSSTGAGVEQPSQKTRMWRLVWIHCWIDDPAGLFQPQQFHDLNTTSAPCSPPCLGNKPAHNNSPVIPISHRTPRFSFLTLNWFGITVLIPRMKHHV